MATYSEDFSSYAEDSSPASFVHYGADGKAHKIVAHPNYSGGKALLYHNTAYTTGRRTLYWTVPGAVGGYNEFRIRVRVEVPVSNDMRLTMRGDMSAAVGAENAVFLEIGGQASMGRMETIRWYQAGSLFSIAAVQPSVWKIGEWTNILFYGDATDTFMGKVWREGDPEPGTWNLSGIETAVPDTGHFGIGTFTHSAMEIDAISVGVGEPAPALPALPTPQPTGQPVSPTGLVVTPYGSGVRVSWDAVSGAAGYSVFRNYMFLGSTTTTSLVDDPTPAGKLNYQVSAYKAAT